MFNYKKSILRFKTLGLGSANVNNAMTIFCFVNDSNTKRKVPNKYQHTPGLGLALRHLEVIIFNILSFKLSMVMDKGKLSKPMANDKTN